MYYRPYTRRPSPEPEVPPEIRIPENYSGNAFSPHEPPAPPEPEEEHLPQEPEAVEAGETAEPQKKQEKSLLSSLLPVGLADSFPFGHGIGTEELLLIGVMLLILHGPDRGDHDVLLLLGLLLFCG